MKYCFYLAPANISKLHINSCYTLFVPNTLDELNVFENNPEARNEIIRVPHTYPKADIWHLFVKTSVLKWLHFNGTSAFFIRMFLVRAHLP
jgi:hypothetical protein